jgi:glutamyl-tRNA synthetase
LSVRTRYAPSPTGFLHVGGLRTALYNYLFARKEGGQFILRIEDTDQTRKVDGAVDNLLDAFAWIEIPFDEGPHIGGDTGPYIQSERLDLYRAHIKILAESGHAYPCFCSSERLEKMRDSQVAQSIPPMYDRQCRAVTTAESSARIDRGEPHVWRMAIPDSREVTVKDLIRGEVRFDAATIDDQVLLKSDGYPTYHLANVVDDHHMQISHVIRGEEWLPSTPKHILLYEFLGWEAPVFAHLPLLLNPDRSKMSKRSGDVAVEEYRKKGFLPQALINFVALLGWHPQGEREIFSLEDLVHEFSLDRVNKAGAVFDLAKLQWMNSEYIKAESDDNLIEHVRPLVSDLIQTHGSSRVELAILTLRAGAETYLTLSEKIHDLFAPSPIRNPELMAGLCDDKVVLVVGEVGRRLAGVEERDWEDFEKIGNTYKEFASEAGRAYSLKGKSLWMPLRIAMTGREHGPELAKLVGIWGRDRVLGELEKTLKYLKHQVLR